MSATIPPAEPWPALSSDEFAPTRYLVHMVLQAVGKLKLAEPFQAQWSEVPLWLSARGLTTGPIAFAGGAYEVRADFVSHEVEWLTSSGSRGRVGLEPGSVAAVVGALLDGLRRDGVTASITMLPQEVPNPVAFDADTSRRPYDRSLVSAWWRIMLGVERVLRRFQGRFTGKTQPIGLMWGTLDIRAAFYSGEPAAPAATDGFIRRNAMNAGLMEMGWWSGDASYRKPAFYAFTYPQPDGIETAAIGPGAARWDRAMGEFLLDYDELRQSSQPDRDLLTFFETAYAAGATAARWQPELLGSGQPV